MGELVICGGGVRGGGRPSGFGGGGFLNDDVDTINVGRFGCDTPFVFSA